MENVFRVSLMRWGAPHSTRIEPIEVVLQKLKERVLTHLFGGD